MKISLALSLLALSVITSEARPSYAMLNRRFDASRLTDKQREYVWSLELLQLVRPELRDSGALTTWRLSEETSDDPTTREWCVRNRSGWPVKPRPEFLVPSLNFVTAETEAEYT